MTFVIANMTTKMERERDRVASVLHLLHHNRKKYIINSLAIIVFNLI